MSPLWRRVLVEKRSAIALVAIGVLANIGVYTLAVYPLGVRSATAATRAQRAAENLKAAQADFASARALVAGTTRADQELQTFYGKILPSDFPSARRLTYTTLPDLAKKANVRLLERRSDIDDQNVKKTGLLRLAIQVRLEGTYDNFRQFLYGLESAPEFVIVDNVAIEQADATKAPSFAVELSTYYRPGTDGN
jgi:Tfp pilus assembly protein PilO